MTRKYINDTLHNCVVNQVRNIYLS